MVGQFQMQIPLFYQSVFLVILVRAIKVTRDSQYIKLVIVNNRYVIPKPYPPRARRHTLWSNPRITVVKTPKERGQSHEFSVVKTTNTLWLKPRYKSQQIHSLLVLAAKSQVYALNYVVKTTKLIHLKTYRMLFICGERLISFHI